MKVLLISANTEIMNMITLPFGLACVGAATQRAGHEVLLLNLMFEPDTKSAVSQAVASFRPDVIGISVRNIDDQEMASPRFLLAPAKDLVVHCRTVTDAPIILGGPGYSIFPESALRYLGADVGIQGEGEIAFPTLIKRLARGADISDIPGVCLPARAVANRAFATHLDDLPLPDARFWIPPSVDRRNVWIPAQSRRGCPMQCSFCSTGTIEGTSIRRRSPQQVVNWLRELHDAGYRNISFVDNTFNLPPSYAKELCRKIVEAELNLNLWCLVYPKWVDAKLVELMRAAGCCQVSLGFESGSEQVLRAFNKRFDPDDVTTISKMFADAGIARCGFLLLGGPGETRDSVEESLAFADALQLEALRITIGLRIYPQTALAQAAVAEGIVRADEDLLAPRFYVAPSLRDWLPQRAAAYRAARPLLPEVRIPAIN